MKPDTDQWAVWGYTETDRVSLVQYLGSLGRLTGKAFERAAVHQQLLAPELAKALIDAGASDENTLSEVAVHQQPLTLELAKLLIDAGAYSRGAFWWAAKYQQPLPFELAKLLISSGAYDKDALSAVVQHQSPLTLQMTELLVNAGAFRKTALSDAVVFQKVLSPKLAEALIEAGGFDKRLLRIAVQHQQPLSLDLAKLLISAGCDPAEQDEYGWDVMPSFSAHGRPVDPQVTDLFLSCGCRTNLDGCACIGELGRVRLDQILKEHAEWKKRRNRLLAENSQADSAVDWSR